MFNIYCVYLLCCFSYLGENCSQLDKSRKSDISLQGKKKEKQKQKQNKENKTNE